MKIKFLKKVFIIFLISLSLTFVCPYGTLVIRAEDEKPTLENYSTENIFSDAINFVHAGNKIEDTINVDALRNTSSFIYKLLLAIGIIVAIIVGIVIGIQFMVASAENKAKVKEAFVAYVVSCFVLFGAYGIWKIIVTVLTKTTE
jgi:hypothetical protein